jgi:hypothetical protein
MTSRRRGLKDVTTVSSAEHKRSDILYIATTIVAVSKIRIG